MDYIFIWDGMSLSKVILVKLKIPVKESKIEKREAKKFRNIYNSLSKLIEH